MRLIGLGSLLLSAFFAPLAATAQQAPKTTRIGVLFSATPAAVTPNLEALRKGLRELGYVEGTTFVLLPRYGEFRAERLPELARELVSLKADVIVVSTDPAVAAARRETQTIPIVMAVSTDPVGTGFVASLARPGGNVAGLTNIAPALSGKWLELLREAVPRVSRARRPPCRAAHQVRVCDQPQDREGARADDSAFGVATGRRDHSVTGRRAIPPSVLGRADQIIE